jgi:amino acid adenylation domain-containing protein
VSEQVYGGSPFHLLFSADICGPLDPARLELALARLTRRHPSLRTVFTCDDSGTLTGRVLPTWQPTLVQQELPAQTGGDLVADVHTLLAPAAAGFLRPFERPPVVFVLSQADDHRAILSLVVHHAVVDGWSIGLLWRELATEYEMACTRPSGEVTVQDMDPAVVPFAEPMVALGRADTVQDSLRQRTRMLDGLPATVQVPSDLERPQRRTLAGTRLVFGLSDAARLGCASLAGELGLTRNTILLAAWALVVARRAAVSDLVMGMASAGRSTAESLHVVGLYANLLPVACQVTGHGSVADYLHQTASAMRTAMDASEVPFDDIIAALGLGGDESRNPLVQVAFAAHDELIPAVLHSGDLTLEIREGHCGGTSYDALLYVQRWGDNPRLALEYATAVLRADEAAALARAVDRTLAEMAATPHGRLADVTTMTAAQRRRLESLGTGPAAVGGTGLWPLIEQAALRCPDAVAVRDGDPARTMTYRELLRAAEVQSAELCAAGVSEGDSVALAVRPSAREIVAILAVLRLGAAYVGIDPGTPPAMLGAMLDAAGAAVVLGDEDRLTSLGDVLDGRAVLGIADPWRSAASDRPVPAAASAGPDHIAYVAFTSGSTGAPKGIRVPHRGVVRLTLNPAYLRPGACERFVRLAPLAFDASTLEIFAPLVIGGTVEVFPGHHVTPAELAEFLDTRRITGLWLTAGLFRLVADYYPDAFAGVRQVLTGGDVVPAGQVASVLRACPGLRVTNGYGPAENTTFTTVHHVDDAVAAEDPLPIGRPIQGTGVLVLDAAGRMVPPGGIGELYTYGDGLALGYAGLPAETAHAFGHLSPETRQRLYRTGDLVRWDTAGRLCFLGRRDRQVKIRGFRIELDQVARVLREHPAARDVAVVATGSTPGDRRLLAGIVVNTGARDDPARPESLRAFAADRLPAYAIPSLWAVVPELPVTRNGKLDAARLHELATGQESRPAATPNSPVPAAAGRPRFRPTQSDDTSLGERDHIERIIASAWHEVLGTGSFGVNERFFEVGGDSLQLIRVAAILRRNLPDHRIAVQDLHACQTIGTLAVRLRARSARPCDVPCPQ